MTPRLYQVDLAGWVHAFRRLTDASITSALCAAPWTHGPLKVTITYHLSLPALDERASVSYTTRSFLTS